MIASLKGILTEIANKYAVLELGGIGYKVFITDDTLHTLKVGGECFFWIHMAVREDAQDLFGFISKKERDLFEMLITVSGIGPRTALNILSLASVDTLISSIKTGSVAHLVKVSGIGKKTAEKITIELGDKLGAIASDDSAMSADVSRDLDAIEALKALGYDVDEARNALKKTDKDIVDTGMKIKAALKVLGR